ncbi:cell adhesion molecule CEACAM1-like isoform X2 [Lithobates pipiens]
MACAWFLLSCVLLLCIAGAGFAYQVENGILEGSVTFYESLPIHGNPLLRWTFKNALIARLFPGGTPMCVDQYVGRCTLYENGTLRLNSLTFADDGNYTMTAQYLITSLTKESTYGLRIHTVLGSPALHCNDTSNSLISGTYLSIYCDAGSLNVITYTFYRDGKNICSKPHVTCQDSYLYFQPITESDSGNYTCTIQNPVSSNTSNTLQLNVSVPVSDVKLASNATGLVWPELDVVSLTCSARDTDVTYSWSLQGAPLPQNPPYYLSANNTVLTIRPITANDNGTFTCTASNWINNETSDGVIFNLAWNPEASMSCNAVNISGNVELGCSWPGGHPAANLSLIFNGVSDNGQNSVTRVMSTSHHFQGSNLTCFGDQLGRTSQCSLIFDPTPCPISHGLGGGEVAGIVIAVVAGITIIEVIVFFILKTTKKPHLGTKNENSNAPPPHTYSTIIPGTEINSGKQQTYYENRAIYNNLEPSTGK